MEIERNRADYKSFKRKRKFHDAWAAVLYFILTIVVITMGIFNIVSKKGQHTDIGQPPSTFNNIISYNFLTSILIGLATFFLLLSLTFWLCKSHPKFLIYSAFIFQIISGIVVCFLSKSLLVSILGLISPLLLTLFFFFQIRPNIEYICKMLYAASHILMKYILQLIGLVMLYFLFVFILTGFIRTAIDDKTEKSMLLLSVGLLSIFWSINIAIYMLQVMVTSIVTGHITSEEAKQRHVILYDAVYNTACAFGSICFGSLILAIVQVLKALISKKRRDDEQSDVEASAGARIILFIAKIILVIFEDIVLYMNSLVYSYIAVHGTGYTESIHESFEAISQRGCKALATYGSIGVIVSLLTSSYFFIMAAVGLLFFHLLGKDIFKEVGTKHFASLKDYFIPNMFFLILYSVLLSMLSSAVLALIYCKVEFSEKVRKYDSEVYGCMERKNADTVR